MQYLIFKHALIGKLFCDRIFIQVDHACHMGISGAVSGTYDVIAVFQNISCFCFIIRRHLIGIEGYGDDLAFARCQHVGLAVRCQFLIWFFQFAVRSGEVNFYDFFAGVGITGIFSPEHQRLRCLHLRKIRRFSGQRLCKKVHNRIRKPDLR